MRSRASSIAGLGYATPYLEMFRDHPLRLFAMMPAEQGVVNWPASGPSSSTLIDDSMLPLPDSCVDRMLLAHALENAEHPRELLSEVWRVLTPGGRLVVVAPNRSGLWARLDTTPFGHGRPYSRGQLLDLMRETSVFADLLERGALHAAASSREAGCDSRRRSNGSAEDCRFRAPASSWSRRPSSFIAWSASRRSRRGLPELAPALTPALAPGPLGLGPRRDAARDDVARVAEPPKIYGPATRAAVGALAIKPSIWSRSRLNRSKILAVDLPRARQVSPSSDRRNVR